jgi:SpoVK/Ycf46/Vps4 family AAA+-type ATPase
MGQIMLEEHLLPDNRFACVNGAELKGMYVGHSAPKTKALFEENDIIVIDEAYSIVGDRGESDSFSKEAIAQLIIELEEHSTDKLVIFAGYGGRMVNEKNNKMKDFLDSNPGIKSRITSTIYFDSYTPEQMADIFMNIAGNQKYIVDENARGMVVSHFTARIKDENFGNGREARSLLETAVVYAANRVFKDDKKQYTKEELQTITCEDIAAAIKQVEKADLDRYASVRMRKIGFGGTAV